MRPLLHKFDERVKKVVDRWPTKAKFVMQFATTIGQPVFTVGISVFAIGLGWSGANPPLMYAGIVALAVLVLSAVIKLILKRNRPLTEYVTRMWMKTYSLPSGHAVGAIASYGLVGYVVSRSLTGLETLASLVFFIFLIGMIGISRIYLGAHYATDVVAGWLLGGVALAIIIGVLQPTL
jgi:undecaprenyl-diphosphatase